MSDIRSAASQNRKIPPAGLALLGVLAAIAVFFTVRSRTPRSPVEPDDFGALVWGPQSHPVRVSLTGTPVPEVRIALDHGGTIHDEQDKKIGSWLRTPPLSVTRESSSWTFGNEKLAVQTLTIRPLKSPGIWVEDRLYRGIVHLIPDKNTDFHVVNELPLEEYVAAVVDAEMPATFPPAAREAQAIVARSYAYSMASSAGPTAPFHLFSTPRSQNYLGHTYRDASGRLLAGETIHGRTAVRATRGLICTFQRAPFKTYYHAVCGGFTIPGRLLFPDYPQSITGVDCNDCREAPLHTWSRTVDVSKLDQVLSDWATTRQRKWTTLRTIRQVESNSHQALPRFSLSDGALTLVFSGHELRQLLGPSLLPSPQFQLHREKDQLIFDGYGHGHGVGLCQWGARGIASHGATFREIVEFYYPGAKIEAIDQSVSGSR